MIVSWIIAIIAPIIAGLVVVFVNAVLKRLDTIEVKTNQSVTEQQVRDIVTDKFNPLKEDITEIKANVKELISRYIYRGHSNG